ncbi:class I tRNA ligase family protein, partial [bacterium]|nr:class I tRNA ligase family protein [bacterium]
TEILKAGDAVNAYFAANTPWILAKDESQRERYEAVIYTTLDALRLIALAVYPFMPITSEKILASLGVHDSIKAEFLPMKLPVQAQTVVGEPLFPFIG